MTFLWTLLTKNPIARAIAWAVMGALALITFGKVNQRKGRKEANAARDLKDLKGFNQTTERMQDAEAAMGDDPAALREWLRQRDPDQR